MSTTQVLKMAKANAIIRVLKEQNSTLHSHQRSTDVALPVVEVKLTRAEVVAAKRRFSNC